MTDKQIIDRVNVKECKYYCNGKCERYEEFVEADYVGYSVKCICEKENDLGTYDICDYQQFKRKEQECERLKKRLNSQCFDPKNNNGRCISYNRMAEDYENDLRQLQAEKEKVNKYKQTLEEIKEIARKTLNMVDYKTYFKRDNKSIKQEGFKAIEQILQKCEVLDE